MRLASRDVKGVASYLASDACQRVVVLMRQPQRCECVFEICKHVEVTMQRSTATDKHCVGVGDSARR